MIFSCESNPKCTQYLLEEKFVTSMELRGKRETSANIILMLLSEL